MFYRFIRRMFIILASVIMPIRVVGRENINRAGGYILACNHQTSMDIPALIVSCKRTIHFMAKSSFFDHKILGYFFSKMKAFPVHTKTGDVESLRHAMKVLKGEQVLGIFPQGRRVKSSPVIKREDLLSGIALIALKTRVPIVPCMLEKKPLLFRRNTLHVGEAITMDKYQGRRVNNDLLQEVTNELFDAMMALLPKEVKMKYQSIEDNHEN